MASPQILHPAYPGSIYHATKCLDALLFQVWSLSSVLYSFFSSRSGPFCLYCTLSSACVCCLFPKCSDQTTSVCTHRRACDHAHSHERVHKHANLLAVCLFSQFYNKNDGIRVTDLHQGIVWGTNTPQVIRARTRTHAHRLTLSLTHTRTHTHMCSRRIGPDCAPTEFSRKTQRRQMCLHMHKRARTHIHGSLRRTV